MSEQPIHGACEAQHTTDAIVNPSEPVCTGRPHIGPIRLDDTPTWEDRWALLRFHIPPSWTVVAVERLVISPTESEAHRGWWVYVEPSATMEPDPQKRMDARINVERPTLDEALVTLTQHLESVNGIPSLRRERSLAQ